MKRCPECRRDYYDDTLLYCLEDGTSLVQGSVPVPVDGTGEPATAVFGVPHVEGTSSEAATRAQNYTTDQTAILQTGAGAEPRDSLGGLSEKQSLSARRSAKPFIALIAAVLVLGGFVGYRYFKPSTSGQINSIAVLPFENKSGNADSDYLSDGVTESLIYKLSQLPDLKVSPRSSVFRYKGKEIDAEKVGSELGVDAVMSGRMVQRGDSLTISVDLVDVKNNKTLWGEQYERKMSDLLATQRDIASAIIQKLQLKLTGVGEQKLAKKYTDNNDAYQLYLKGRYYWAKRTRDDIPRAIESYQKAIALDPNFALAYARIAEAYYAMPSYGYISPKEAWPESKSAAERALQIDPTLSEAHAALGSTLASYERNLIEGEREALRAIELDPNSATAHFRYGQYLTQVGRYDEAITEVRRSVELEPLDIGFASNLSRSYLYARQFDKALEQGKSTYDLEPGNPAARYHLCQAQIAKGMYAEAIDISEAGLRSDPENQIMLVNVGYAYARSGQRDKAKEIIDRFIEIGRTKYVISYLVAAIYAALGDKDKAFAELEKAYAERDWPLSLAKGDPMMDPLRDDPRFKDLLKRMNLPE